jgi:hypothetical protein
MSIPSVMTTGDFYVSALDRTPVNNCDRSSSIGQHCPRLPVAIDDLRLMIEKQQDNLRRRLFNLSIAAISHSLERI